MGKHSRTLKTLRNIALEYGSSEQPDLALMARELGWTEAEKTSYADAYAGEIGKFIADAR